MPFAAQTTFYDKDGHVYWRQDNEITVERNGHVFDNRSVVPYNKYLSKVFNAHINVKKCSSVGVVKYVYKGHDGLVTWLLP